MTNILEIERRRLLDIHLEHARDDYPEANDMLNDASRRVIRAMKEERGEAWLGHINLYHETRGKPPIWKWDGGMVYNFGAAFVLPAFDADLEKLILERDSAPYSGTTADATRVDAIIDRIRALGGVLLPWS